MSLYGLTRSVFWPRKRSSCWPLPRLSVLVSSMLCRIVSLIPGAGLRFPFLSSRASWQRLRIPLPLLLGLRAFLYRPYKTREIIAMGDCYVLCGRSGVTLTALLHIVRSVSGCLSPQGVARRIYRRPLSPPGSGRQYHGPTSSRVRNSLFLPLEAGMWRRHTTFTRHYLRDLAHRSLDTFHLDPVVGGTGLGLTLACSPGHSTPK